VRGIKDEGRETTERDEITTRKIFRAWGLGDNPPRIGSDAIEISGSSFLSPIVPIVVRNMFATSGGGGASTTDRCFLDRQVSPVAPFHSVPPVRRTMDGRDGRFRETYRDFMPLSTRGEDDSFIVKWTEILGRNFRCAFGKRRSNRDRDRSILV